MACLDNHTDNNNNYCNFHQHASLPYLLFYLDINNFFCIKLVKDGFNPNPEQTISLSLCGHDFCYYVYRLYELHGEKGSTSNYFLIDFLC